MFLLVIEEVFVFKFVVEGWDVVKWFIELFVFIRFFKKKLLEVG